ncbi:hypothetical protein [Magnetospirillum sp. SS-4]|uniref:hypothetical protein n=1 Tax=Magnetospirillum sp. SS-4 TaxID=2681465 RepID=UPI001385E522|nr:hypothetical protein [Magnetospirillum sp. SS-4]CAA7617536.1 exported hypothetical protein [Magnetospirillum sp. SS-4]
MIRIVAAAMLVLAVSGCASGQDFWANMKSRVGPPLASGSETAAAAGTATPATLAAPAAFGFCASCLTDSAGRMVAASDTVRGDLERVAADGDMLVFVGWAADTGGNIPAKAVIFVSNGAVVAQIVPDKPRPDVSAALKSPRHNDFGFEARIPKTSLGQSTSFWIVGADDKAAALNKVFQQ